MKVSTTSSSMLSKVMTGEDSAPCARMLVFWRLIVSPNSLQAWDSLSTRSWRPSSLWDVKAVSSANSSSRMSTTYALVLARSLAMLKSLPSDLVRTKTPSLQSTRHTGAALRRKSRTWLEQGHSPALLHC